MANYRGFHYKMMVKIRIKATVTKRLAGSFVAELGVGAEAEPFRPPGAPAGTM